MKRLVAIANASEFAEALEDWIIKEKCDPKTPEEWNRCVEDMLKNGSLTPITFINEKDTEEFKEKLKNNFNVKGM